MPAPPCAAHSTTRAAGVQARDPIPQFRSWALAEGLLSEAQVKEIDASVTEEVEDAVKFADESPKPVRNLLC